MWSKGRHGFHGICPSFGCGRIGMRISSQIPMPDRPLAARLELRLLQASMVFPAFPPLPLARLPRRTAPRSRFRAGQAGGVLNRFGAYGERRDIAVGQTGDRQRISGRMRRKSKSGPGLRTFPAGRM
jgi:hypothetical protein